MQKSSITSEENWKETASDRCSLSNLDLLNLRFTPEDFPETDRHSLAGSGDWVPEATYKRRHYHPLQKASTRHLVPNLNNLPQGYGKLKYEKVVSPDRFVYTANSERNPELVFTDPISQKDFLYPTKKKLSVHNQFVSKNSNREKEEGVFPFKLTPSGNLKVKSQQVIFASEKFSVLVADPDNTKININDQSIKNSSKMSQDYGEIPKNAMDTILSQGGLTSLGSLLGQTPQRSAQKEASEYESKNTAEILDPELNLGRIGFCGNEDIQWEKVKLPEKKNLYLELYSRITNYTNADCKIYIDHEEFNCHLIVLQCYSELFDAYIAVKKVELPSDKCSASSFGFIYEWMITGEPSYKELNRQNVLDIFNAAKYLKIKDLVEQCWAFIDNTEIFSEDTAFLLYVDAKAKNLPEVRELMLPRIQHFFLMLVSSHDWLELEIEDVKNFLKSNYICINCEMEVFMAAVRWLKHDVDREKNYKYEVLDCVRFGNIAPWQLVDIKRNSENEDFTKLASDPAICKMIDDGLAYVIIKYWYGQENDDFQHWNSVLGLQEPTTRNWSGSDKTYFTYREFLIYLDQYRRTQLMDKNKPKTVSQKLNGMVEGPITSMQVMQDRISPRVPTMDEFLSKKKARNNVPILKKKELYSSSDKQSGSYRGYHATHPEKKIVEKPRNEEVKKRSKIYSETYAAVIIQRAYRSYRQRKKFKEIISKNMAKKSVCQNLSKTRVLNMFKDNKTAL